MNHHFSTEFHDESNIGNSFKAQKLNHGGGGGLQPKKKTEKTSPKFEICGSVRFLRFFRYFSVFFRYFSVFFRFFVVLLRFFSV